MAESRITNHILVPIWPNHESRIESKLTHGRIRITNPNLVLSSGESRITNRIKKSPFCRIYDSVPESYDSSITPYYTQEKCPVLERIFRKIIGNTILLFGLVLRWKSATSILDKNVCLPSLLWVFHSTGFTGENVFLIILFLKN